jgi:hypothetical protein
MDIVSSDIFSLIDSWYEAEQNGNQFPVDFDVAWKITGYSRKDSAKRKLPKSSQGKLYHKSVEKTGGRPVEKIHLSCDGLKHLGLMSETSEGEAIRQYFIEVEKKWKLAEKVNPEFTQQIELMKLHADIATANASMMSDQRFIMEKSEVIMNLHGPQVLALIQGRPDAVVEKVEKITETVICQNGRNVSFEGKSTADLGRELGFKTGKQFEQWLTQIKHQGLICEGFRAVQAPYIPTENIRKVKELWAQYRKAQGTQLLLGDS